MPESLFAAETPTGSFNDAATYELGLAFRADVDGTVSGVAVYGPSTPPTSITVSLYAIDSSVAGTLLASKLAGAPLTPNTWNLILFDAPVAITAGVIYRVQHRTPDWYTHTSARFSAAVTVGHLTAIQDAVEPPADPYRNGSLLVGVGYAAASASAAWFGNDVLFTPAGAGVVTGAAALASAGTLGAAGRVVRRGTAALASGATLAVAGRRVARAQLLLTAAAHLTARHADRTSAPGVLTASGAPLSTLTASGQPAATLAASGTP